MSAVTRLAVLALAAMPLAAEAGIVGDATSAPVTVTVAPGDTLTFSYSGTAANALQPLSVATGGAILLASDPFGPGGTEVSAFEIGSTIDNTLTYTAFPTASVIPYSVSDEFIGFSLPGTGGTHYGFAEVAGPYVEAVDLEGTAGFAATTGTVPEPAALALFGAGVVALIAGRRIRTI